MAATASAKAWARYPPSGAQDVNALEPQCIEEGGGSRRHRTDIVEIRGIDGQERQGRVQPERRVEKNVPPP
jgi:hypothetical protein